MEKFMYTCVKCKRIYDINGKNKVLSCPYCLMSRLLYLDISADEWNRLSEKEQTGIIENKYQTQYLSPKDFKISLNNPEISYTPKSTSNSKKKANRNQKIIDDKFFPMVKKVAELYPDLYYTSINTLWYYADKYNKIGGYKIFFSHFLQYV